MALVLQEVGWATAPLTFERWNNTGDKNMDEFEEKLLKYKLLHGILVLSQVQKSHLVDNPPKFFSTFSKGLFEEVEF